MFPQVRSADPMRARVVHAVRTNGSTDGTTIQGRMKVLIQQIAMILSQQHGGGDDPGGAVWRIGSAGTGVCTVALLLRITLRRGGGDHNDDHGAGDRRRWRWPWRGWQGGDVGPLVDGALIGTEITQNDATEEDV